MIFKLYLIKNFNYLKSMGIGDWGLGIGPNPQSPIPNPQSPIPNPHINSLKFYQFLTILKIIIN
jgi:hypothetical protein